MENCCHNFNFATSILSIFFIKPFLLMNILLVGGGGREHTLAWKLKQSALCEQLFIAPGNAGTSQVGINVALATTDFAGLASFCLLQNWLHQTGGRPR